MAAAAQLNSMDSSELTACVSFWLTLLLILLPRGKRLKKQRKSKPGTIIGEQSRHTLVRIGKRQRFLTFVDLKTAELIPLGNEHATLQPGASIVGSVSGTGQVILRVERADGSGAHNHPGGLPGTIEPDEVDFGSQWGIVAVKYTAPEAAGDFRLAAIWNDGQIIYNYVNVSVPNLVELTSGQAIVLTGATTSHPRNNYGTPDLVSKVQQLAQTFFAKFKRPLYVNDMSLPFGGLFDFQATWSPPHRTHRDGRRVDINSNSMNGAQKRLFKATAESLGFKVLLESKPPHWHLEL